MIPTQHDRGAPPEESLRLGLVHRARIWLAKFTGFATLLVCALVCGVSALVWSAFGSGSSSAVAASFTPITFGTLSVPNTLYPGSTVNVSVQIVNPNAFAVTITGTSVGTVVSNAIGCGDSGSKPTGVTLNLSAITGSLAASATTTITASASMTTASVSACQGATFSAPLTVAVQR